MARPQAAQPRVGIPPRPTVQPRRRPTGRGWGVIALVVLPLGVVGTQVPWPGDGHDVDPAGFDDAPATTFDAPGSREDTGAVDRNRSDARAADLAARGARLATRARVVDALLAETVANHVPSTCRAALAVERPALGSDAATMGRGGSSIGLRTGDGTGWPGGDGADQPDPDVVAERIGAVEARQAATLSCLNQAVGAHLARVRDALLATGVPPDRWYDGRGIGGPFVPAPAGALDADFDGAAALLRETSGEAARLDGAAGRLPLRKPMEGPVEVTSSFGVRLDPFYGRPALHTGVDLMGAHGAPVAATAAGTVTTAGASGGYGNMVEIDHGRGLVTRYAHLASVSVQPNQRIAAGQVLGRVGATGRATGPHLHYETRVDGEPIDPARFLKAGATLFAPTGGP